MQSSSLIRVLVVETTDSSRLPLDLAGAPGLIVVGVARATQLSDQLERRRPDVVALDLHFPGEAGLDAIRHIMSRYPLPIVAVGENGDEGCLSFSALGAGALAMVQRPIVEHGLQRDEQIATLVQMLKLMSEVRVVRRRPRLTAQPSPPPPVPELDVSGSARVRLIAIGASTGGPAVLQTILGSLPADFLVPIVVVQHITNGFVRSLVEWLQSSSALRLHVAEQNQLLEPGHVYFAPDQHQMGINSSHIVLDSSEPEKGHCPSVGHLFRSVARTCGPHAVGVLLTGMGRDGATELLQMRNQGAVTIAQNRESCIVYGMPGQAEELGAVTHFLPPDKIAPALMALAMQTHAANQQTPANGIK